MDFSLSDEHLRAQQMVRTIRHKLSDYVKCQVG